MEYDKIIEAIDRDNALQYHFTEYEFNELKIKYPGTENSKSLKKEYLNLMNGLKEFLKTKPTKELLDHFILESVNKLDFSKYLEGFEAIILKYNGFNCFILGIDTVKEYFDKKKNELNHKEK
jgi:hypothetical protein